MPGKQTKKSYTVTCSSTFRDSVLKMAESRGVNAADLARSVALIVPPHAIEAFVDPGEPDISDRETVVLKSGKSKGKPWQRKPRLQIRLSDGYSIPYLRKTLAVALELDRGAAHLHLEAPEQGLAPKALYEKANAQKDREEALKRKTIIDVLAFDPLPDGVITQEDAAYVMGYPPSRIPDRAALRARFRALASILHPDAGSGSHVHMSQLNAAMDILRNR